VKAVKTVRMRDNACDLLQNEGEVNRFQKNVCEVLAAKRCHMCVRIRPGSKCINENSCVECESCG
jgi:hypothetical protein